MMTQLDVIIEEQPLTFLIASHDSIQVAGLPYLGVHLYSIKSDTLYVQHPDEKEWLALPVGRIHNAFPTGHLEKGKQSGKFLGTPNQHWAVRVGARTCDHILTNKDAGARTGANVSHFARISAALAYLYGENLGKDSCAAYLIPPVLGPMMGLPIHATGSGGQYDVKKLHTLPKEIAKGIPLPEVYTLLTQESHVRFLARQLTPEARDTFMATSSQLPVAQRLRALKHLLSQK